MTALYLGISYAMDDVCYLCSHSGTAQVIPLVTLASYCVPDVLHVLDSDIVFSAFTLPWSVLTLQFILNPMCLRNPRHRLPYIPFRLCTQMRLFLRKRKEKKLLDSRKASAYDPKLSLV